MRRDVHVSHTKRRSRLSHASCEFAYSPIRRPSCCGMGPEQQRASQTTRSSHPPWVHRRWAGAMRLEIAYISRIGPGVGASGTHACFSREPIGCGQAVGEAVVIDGATPMAAQIRLPAVRASAIRSSTTICMSSPRAHPSAAAANVLHGRRGPFACSIHVATVASRVRRRHRQCSREIRLA